MDLPVNYNKLDWKKRRAVRNAYADIQGGRCHHCKCPLNALPAQEVLEKWVDTSLFPENFFKNPVHLHHNHDTGMTIGTVHARCNAVLWQYFGE